MAAIDPSATPAHTGTLNGDTPARAILRVVYDSSAHRDDDESDLDSEEEAMQMQQLLGADSDDDEEGEESSSDDEEKNGGPSDPSKSKKARKEAAAAQLLKTMKQESSDEEMEDTSSSPVTNGLSSKKNKGKAKASMPEDQESSEEDLDDDAGGLEELVLCTLDPNQVGLSRYFSFNACSTDGFTSTINSPWISRSPKVRPRSSRFLGLTLFISLATMSSLQTNLTIMTKAIPTTICLLTRMS